MSATISAPAAARDLRIPTWQQSHLKGSRAAAAMYILGVCIRDRRLPAAETFLRTVRGSPEEIAVLPIVRPPARDECLMRTNELKFRSYNLIRGAIAEAIYSHSRVKPRSSTALPESTEQFMLKMQNVSPTERVAREVAACTVRKSPMLAQEVIQYNPGRPGEFRALAALEPVFAGCLPPNKVLNVERLVMRASLGEALYQAWRSHPDGFTWKAAK